ncbi:GDSL-type esterase/lipase family protein [Bacillus thuringiensis]
MKKKILIWISVTMNIVFIAGAIFFIVHKGGLGYLGSKMGIASQSDSKISNPLNVIKVEANSINISKHSDIVFLGDSHTDYFQWGEYFSNLNISNQGIAGDKTEDILKRVNQVNAVTPKKVFIMMGINDLQGGSSVENIMLNYQNILSNIKAANPNSTIYIQSVLPVNNEKYPLYFNKDPKILNDEVKKLNKEIEKLSDKNNNVFFINNEGFSEGLSSENTVDGLHLNKKGYELLVKKISEYINN